MKASFRRCPPYEGKEPYLYLCFAEQDREAVFPLLEHLYSRGCRMVLFFQSSTALASPNCLSEIRTAVKQGKTVLLLKLEEIPEEALEPR